MSLLVDHSTKGIAQEWRGTPHFSGEWIRCPNQAGSLDDGLQGESGGFKVYAPALSNRVGYLKPCVRPAGPSFVRAAREKIVSDLAHDLDVRVPPVVLWTRDAADCGEQERFVCISLVMFQRQWSWECVRFNISERDPSMFTEAFLSGMPVDAAKALAFDTWVGQPEHDDHPSNIHWGYQGADLERGCFVFLDYARSLGWSGSWRDGGFSNCTEAPFPTLMLENLHRGVLEQTVCNIEVLSDDSIERVVNRIPSTHLIESEAVAIVEGLKQRRSLIRYALRHHLK